MSLDIEIKLAIYRHFAQTGQRPSPALIAEHVRAKVSEVREAYAQLCAERVLVLEADGESIRMAPPFSGVPTQHLVVIDGISYFANCAWDAFGIPAALHRAGQIRSRCEQSGEPFDLKVDLKGPPPCDWFPQPNGGTILFLPEAICSSSGRKNEFGSGAPHTAIRCARSSRWSNYGDSRRPGMRRACKRTRDALLRTRCGLFLPASVCKVNSGIRSRIVSAKKWL